ncbi:MAG: 3'(2'),5'-bisphosphate nucleotidase CysQ [Thalassovita sp.]
MPAPDLDLLITAVREAGDIACGYAKTGAKSWDKPGDQGPVTEADLAVNEALHAQLTTARPDYGWLSEESDDTTARLNCKHVFIIDPLDGTRSFIEGAQTWAHSLAIAEDGQVKVAAVFLPLLDRLYTAVEGQGAFLNGAPIQVSDRVELTGASVLAASPNYRAMHWKEGAVPDVKQAYRPSLAYRMSLVAQGRYDAMLTTRDSWEWDIAAGDLITREAGGIVSDTRGAALTFNNPHPKLKGVVAAGASVHGQITERLAGRPD